LLNFISGTIAPATDDQLVIYDGLTTDSPVLYQHSGQSTQNSLAGLAIYSSGPQIMMVLTSNGTNSCASGTQNEWVFQIACLSCALPQATVNVMDNCANETFTIDMNITSTGEGATVDLIYTVNGVDQVMNDLPLGPVVLGPFPVGQVVTVALEHELDALCNVTLGSYTDSGMCPTLVVCGAPEVNETYCYANNDNQFWYYELVGTDGPLYLQFTGGSIETSFYDHLTIYDGPDANSPILFDHTTLATVQLAGVAVFSTTGSLFMTMSSDGSVSCTSGAMQTWQWLVTCLNCHPPVATFEIVQDCDNDQYYIDVNLSALGSDPDITITNNAQAPTVSISAPGTVLVGPFPTGTTAQITLVNDDNPLCNVVSPVMVNPICPTMVCGTTPLVETYCYGPNANMEWAYGVSEEGQVRVKFNRGTMESVTFDRLTIYDGPDDQSPILFAHNQTLTAEFGPPGSALSGPGNYYYSVDVTSTGPIVYMRLTSDGSVQCTTTLAYDEMEWEVSCVGCTPPGVNYELVPNCEQLSYHVEVEITETSGPLGFTITELVSGQTEASSQPTTFSFGTMAVDSVSLFVLSDLDNPGCTYETGPITFSRPECVITSCGLDSYSLCYQNSDERWYTYQSEGDYPVSIFFQGGQMLPGDQIVIFNSMTGGPEDFIIYAGNNNSGNLLGITANSANPQNALTLLIRSNSEGSCADGQVETPITWHVGCGYVGIEEEDQMPFSIHPNPTNGLLTIEFGTVPATAVNVHVMDMSGRLVHEELLSASGTDRNMLDLSKLQNGQYMMRLSTNDWMTTRGFQVLR
jgi:hypothetical protein